MSDRVRVVQFQVVGKPEEGYLSVMEAGKQVPFVIARTFITYDTPQSVMRGGHAHRNTEMVILATQGTIYLSTEDRYGIKEQYELNSPAFGIYLPTFCWHTMRYSPGAVQMVMASTLYDRKDYIFDYDEFTRIRQTLIRE